MQTWTAPLVAVLFVVSPFAPADAQVASAPTRPARLEITVGLSGIHLDLGDGRYPRHASGRPAEFEPVLQATVAWRWKPPVTIEADVACVCHTRRDTFDEQIVLATGFSTHLFYEHAYHVIRPAVAVVYELRQKGRVRPFAGASFAADFQRVSDERVEYREGPLSAADEQVRIREGVVITNAEIVPSAFAAHTSTSRAHVFGRAGVKIHFSRRWFFVIEGQAGTRVAPIRIGIGSST